MVNEKTTKSNYFLKSNNPQRNLKPENKKFPEFKNFAERKLKISLKNKQRYIKLIIL